MKMKFLRINYPTYEVNRDSSRRSIREVIICSHLEWQKLCLHQYVLGKPLLPTSFPSGFLVGAMSAVSTNIYLAGVRDDPQDGFPSPLQWVAGIIAKYGLE